MQESPGEPTMDHINAPRLFDLSQADAVERSIQPDTYERQHLHDCEECQRMLEVFAREFSGSDACAAGQMRVVDRGPKPAVLDVLDVTSLH